MYKVLIVDDEKIIRIALKSMINWEAEGFSICGTASSSEAALQIIREQHPHFILTDIMMPKTDGIEFIKQVRRLPFTGPIVILSNYDNFNYAVEALHSNVFDYLLKTDISPEGLILLLRRVKEFLINHPQAPLPQEKLPLNRDELTLSSIVQGTAFPEEEEPFSEPWLFFDIFLRSKVLRQKSETAIPKDTLKNLIEEIPEFSGYLALPLTKDSLLLLIRESQRLFFLSSLLERKEKLNSLIKLYMNTDCGFVCSSTFHTPKSFRLKLKRLPDAEQLVLYENFHCVIPEAGLEICIGEDINLSPLLLQISQCIHDENYQECKKSMANAFTGLKRRKIRVPILQKALSGLFSFLIFDNSIYLNSSQKELQKIASDYHLCCTLDEYLDVLGELTDLIAANKSSFHSPRPYTLISAVTPRRSLLASRMG